MKTKVYPILLLLFTALLSTGCQNKKEKPTIGFCMDRFVTDRWEKDRDFMREAIIREGGTLIMEAAQGDTARQRRQVKRLIEQDVDVLIILPADQDAASSLPEAAHRAGIPVIAYDRLIKNSDIDYYMTFDNIRVGELQARYITRRQPEGNYVLLGGPTYDYNSFLVRLGQLNVLQPLVKKGDVDIIYDKYVAEWKTEEARRLMKECLAENKDKPIDAVLAANDQLAAGAIQALEEAGLAGKVSVAGMDANLNALRNILNGKQTMTVYKPVKTLAAKTARAAVNLAKEGRITQINDTIHNGRKSVKSVIVQPKVVHRKNIRNTVVKDGYWSEKQIFGEPVKNQAP